jgi:rSAM/selenodomain-associated transferase 2
MNSAPPLSIIVPVLDEGELIRTSLARLAPLREEGAEVIVVDGGSRDDTMVQARALCDRLIEAPRGRAIQMNAGARLARGEVLLFLHSDCRLPPDASRTIIESLQASQRAWGRFDVRIEGRDPLLRVVAWFMSRRSRLTGIATGDQGIFVRADVFRRCGGFPDVALMEDIRLSRALKRVGRPLCLRARITTSGRRWEENGTLRTIALMWRLRLAHFLGADPRQLAARYDAARR